MNSSMYILWTSSQENDNNKNENNKNSKHISKYNLDPTEAEKYANELKACSRHFREAMSVRIPLSECIGTRRLPNNSIKAEELDWGAKKLRAELEVEYHKKQIRP